MLVGIGATLAVLALLAWLLILVVRRLRSRLRGSLRYGLANVSRRAGTSIAQVSALGLGLMALLLLTFVRTDLLDRWQLSLAADAPNRFIINVQADQVQPVRAFIAAAGPRARRRCIRWCAAAWSRTTASRRSDRRATTPADATSARTAPRRARVQPVQRRARCATTTRSSPASSGTTRRRARRSSRSRRTSPRSLGWKLGDRIAFDIAGQRFEAPITSLRSVDWESFRPNFFVIASPGALDGYPGQLHHRGAACRRAQPRFTADLVERFPNLSVIDVDAVLKQVRATGDQVSTVVQVVFWFSLAAGVLVLLAAISASQDERLLEGGVMRVLGGSRRQLRLAQASEFAAIGLLSGLVAAIAASVLSGVDRRCACSTCRGSRTGRWPPSAAAWACWRRSPRACSPRAACWMRRRR